MNKTGLSLALLLLAGVPACTKVEFNPAAGMTSYPATQKLLVLKEIPQRPYITLGDIVARGDNPDKMMARIREKALATGAEAIILTPTGEESNSFESVRKEQFATSRLVMRAIAIRFREK